MPTNDLSIHHLSFPDLEVLDFVRLAAREGCTGVGLFVNDLGFGIPLVTERNIAAVTSALRQEGVTVSGTCDFVLLADEGVGPHLPYLELSARLGSKYAVAVAGDADPTRAAHIVGQFAEKVGAFGMRLAMEFVFTTPGTPNLAVTNALVNTVAADNVDVLLDITHFMRTKGTLEQLRNMDTSRIRYVHLSDGPANIAPDKLEEEIMLQRSVPGEGDFPIREILSLLPRDAVYEIEAPNRALATSGATVKERAQRNIRAARALIGAH